jgi:uncharacterized protein (DUF1684 family)
MLKVSSAAVAVLALVVQSAGYRSDVEAFRKQRAADIGGEAGWAALTDLAWLANGEFTIGRGLANAIVLKAPSAPERLGTLTVTPQAATLRLAPGVSGKINNQAVTDPVVPQDVGPSGGLVVGGVTMAVIERGGQRGLRVWDRVSPTRVNFRGLQWYPIDEKWRVDAKFVAHQPAPKMRIQNIVGQTVEMVNPGTVTFTLGGRSYTLEALLEEPDAKEYFFMFKDATSGKTTYGAGRYLYTPLAKDGKATLDFNTAMNPPCAFTEFATCPLPPAKNRLTAAIEAGEKEYQPY